ncbi:hypothetical protein TNCT_509551, partial [Trichonephila clavata]
PIKIRKSYPLEKKRHDVSNDKESLESSLEFARGSGVKN